MGDVLGLTRKQHAQVATTVRLRKTHGRRPRRRLVHRGRVAGEGGGPAECPDSLEINTVGGIHFRFVCNGVPSTWESIPAVVCDEGAQSLPVTPPT